MEENGLVIEISIDIHGGEREKRDYRCPIGV